MTAAPPDKQRVKDFWNRNVCHVSFLKEAEPGSLEFFEQAEALRYRYHYHLLPLFDQLAQRYPGGKLLEIGCSMGTDLLALARRGFMVTGLDLTEAGIELARKRFGLYGFPADLRVADAENLPFEDNSFDLVYSFGVLHHTPDTEKSVIQAHRVIKPGGAAVVMLYHKFSLNNLAHILTGIPADGSKTDPVPLARTYSIGQIKRLFCRFSRVRVRPDYLFGTGWGRVNELIPSSLHRFLGRFIGWHLMIEAVK
ncbi:MAG: class I SAM-dependent methyltransferase [Thermodesulfobacteriota bacterium]